MGELILPDVVDREKLFASLMDFVSLLRKLGVVATSEDDAGVAPAREVPVQQVPVQQEGGNEKELGEKTGMLI